MGGDGQGDVLAVRGPPTAHTSSASARAAPPCGIDSRLRRIYDPIGVGNDEGRGLGMTVDLFIAFSEAAGGAAGDVVGGVDEEGEG